MDIGSEENTTRSEFTITQGIDYEAPKKNWLTLKVVPGSRIAP